MTVQIITLADMGRCAGEEQFMEELRNISNDAFSSVDGIEITCVDTFYDFVFDLYATTPQTPQELFSEALSRATLTDEESIDDGGVDVPGVQFHGDGGDDVLIFLKKLSDSIWRDISRSGMYRGIMGIAIETYRMIGISKDPIRVDFINTPGSKLCLEITYP